MKAKLHIDLDKEQKDLVKLLATLRGQTIRGYIMTLLENDFQKNRQVHSGGTEDLLGWSYSDRPFSGTTR